MSYYSPPVGDINKIDIKKQTFNFETPPKIFNSFEIIDNYIQFHINDRPLWKEEFLIYCCSDDNYLPYTSRLIKKFNVNINLGYLYQQLRKNQQTNKIETTDIILNPLHQAVTQNQIKTVKFLLENKAFPDPHDHNNWTPLFHAVNLRYMDIIKLLIKYGANINYRDKNKNTPIFYAIKSTIPYEQLNHDYTDLDIIKQLVVRGADINAKQNNGRTPLLEAMELKKTNIIEYLLQTGSDPNYSNIVGDSILNWVVYHNYTTGLSLLLKYGVNLDKNISNKIIFTAIKNKNLQMLKILYSYGVSFDLVFTSDNKDNPLQYAIIFNSLEISIYLINNGIPINYKNKLGQDALFLAISSNNLEIVKILIEHGADINSKDNQGNYPIIYSLKCKESIIPLYQYLLNHGFNFLQPMIFTDESQKQLSFLYHILKLGRLEVIKFLIDCGLDCNYVVKGQFTLVYYATIFGHLPIVKFLIRSGADYGLKFPSRPPLLHIAVQYKL